ncbi:MAG: exosortase system-associated protein, TIGR04073 family [Methylovulum sp.]|nr:exosortase system-associated protein, TIGR04073 family [Methylovulum sp.]
MTICNRFFAVFLFAGAMTVPAAHADPIYGNTGMPAPYTPTNQQKASPQNQTYGQKTGNKAINALTNIGTGVLEVPKNVINTTNDSNIFYGITGGLFKGLLNTWGRMSVGITDLLSVAIPTKPVTYPLNVWEDTKVDTTYGNIFELDLPTTPDPVIVETPAPRPSAAVVAPRLPVVDNTGQYNHQQTNQKIDTLFKKQMMK